MFTGVGFHTHGQRSGLQVTHHQRRLATGDANRAAIDAYLCGINIDVHL
jgi:hypothetical protein